MTGKPTEPPTSDAATPDAAIMAALETALAHQRAGRLQEAAAGYESVLRQSPQQFHALHLLAVVEAERGRPAQAMERFRAAIEVEPRHADALRNFGSFLQTQGQLDAAIAMFRRALAIKPDFATAQSALGIALRMKGDYAGAEAACREAIRLNPQQVVAHMTLAALHKNAGRTGEAIAAYRRALELDAANGRARAMLYHLLRQTCAWDGLAALETAMDRDTAAAIAAGRRPGAGPFVAIARSTDPAFAFRVAKASAADVARHCTPLPAVLPSGGGPLRVGYLSYDFRDHAVGHLIQGLFRSHDRTWIEVAAYSYGPDDGSACRRLLRESADRFIDLTGMPYRDAAARIREDGTEILVDLGGHTQSARMEIAAHRPAPVQASWLGFPGTTGADFFDYALVDATVAPPEHARFFAEKLVYLPHCYLITNDREPVASGRPPRVEAGVPPGGFVFGSFNQAYKIDEAIFGAWLRILEAVPTSILWLSIGDLDARANLVRRAQAIGVTPERIRFADRLADRPSYLARLGLVDLMLDTARYNGHTMTIDSLWAGVPVLTMLGGHFASRVSASLLGAIGLPELIAPDLAAYERGAIELARDPKRLAALRARLAANRETRSLFDTAGFVRGLEEAYRRMSALARAGKPPEPIDLRRS